MARRIGVRDLDDGGIVQFDVVGGQAAQVGQVVNHALDHVESHFGL